MYMEENKNNSSKELKFKYFVSIGMLEDGQKFVQTNVSDEIIGYGMCEFGKKGVDIHIEKLNNPKIQVPKHGIADFLRRR